MSEKITIDQLRIPLNVTQGHSLRQENGSFTFAQDSKVNLPCYVGCAAGYTQLMSGTPAQGRVSKFPLASGATINVNFSTAYDQYYPIGGNATGVSSDEAGYTVGHFIEPTPIYGSSCHIRKFNFTSEVAAIAVGRFCGVPSSRVSICVGSATAKTPGYGYAFGGTQSPYPSADAYYITCIFKLQYAGDQDFNGVGDMQTFRKDGGCFNSLDDGYQFMGTGKTAEFPASPSGINSTLEKIPFASDNCGVCVGSFTDAIGQQLATLSGPEGGYSIAGGPSVCSRNIIGFTFSSGNSSIVQTGTLTSSRCIVRGAGISSETGAFYSQFLKNAIGSIYGFPFASHGDATIVGCYQPNAYIGYCAVGWQV